MLRPRNEIRSFLFFSLLLTNVGMAAAQGNTAQATQSDRGGEETAPEKKKETAVSMIDETASNAVFFGSNTAVTPNQTAATPSYQVIGTGVASGRAPGGLMTSGARGNGVAMTEGIRLYPAIQFGLGYNDNVASSSNNLIGSMVQFYRPELVSEARFGSDRYTLSYHGNYGRYSNSSADDYYNHEVWAAGDNYFSSRARIGWGVGYVLSSDARGATDVATTSEPNRWHAPVVRVFGAYGAKDAIGRFELEGSMMQKRYENNLAVTKINDVDLGMLSGSFFYRIMPKTSLVFELRNYWSDYSVSASTRDNTDTRVYVGATWDITDKTSGTVKVGVSRKNFNSNLYSDASTRSWEGSVRWLPLTYSSLTLMTMRAPVDSTGLGDYLLNTSTNLIWNHRWSRSLSSRATVGSFKIDYINAPREDRITNYGLGLFMDVSRNARLSVDYTYSERSSNQADNDFRRKVLMLGIEAFL